MSSQRSNAVEKDLEKYIKFLALKSTQVVVQSRLGEKMQTNCNALTTGNDWFNLEIQDHPDISAETKSALGLGPNVGILQRLPLCIEISVKTVEGDQMVLEVWSLDVTPSRNQRSSENRDITDAAVKAPQILKGVPIANGTNNTINENQTLKTSHVIYNRMGMLLKSVISLTRVTPAYKLSRCQCPEAYSIYYRVYVDQPQVHLLGDGYNFLSIGELNTIVGTIKMKVSYRTKMTISPTTAPVGQRKGEINPIMLNSNHFTPSDIETSLTQSTEIKKGINGCNSLAVDIEKPMRPGAFVDLSKLRQYTEEDYVLPETPPFEWLLRRNRNESDGEGSLESLNRKSESPASSPLSDARPSNNNNNNMNGALNSKNNNNNGSNINNNMPACKGFEMNGERSSKMTQQIPTTKPASPANFPSTLSQSPLKSLLVPVHRQGSVPNLPPDASHATSTENLNISTNDDDNLLKELNFPFSSPESLPNELAKFYRDCYYAPKLQELTMELDPEVSNSSSVGCSAAAAYASVDSSDFAVIDDLSRELARFETSLEDYDKLVSSLTCSSSTSSRSSVGGLQMSN